VPARRRRDVPSPPRFDPLHPAEIGRLLRERLEEQELTSFPPPEFLGAGLYAIYWVGKLPLYSRLKDTMVPVYVGKAEAGNSSYGYEPNYDANKLWKRIEKHANSVREVEGPSSTAIHRDDFRVRFLALDDAWIVLGERALLREYRPVLWNSIMNGFGSNPPGTARKNARSVWDTVHPGRPRAGQLPNRKFTLGEMLERIERGIEISLTPEGKRRNDLLDQLRSERYPVIWAPAKDRDPNQRLRVSDEHRFLAEIERMGISISDNDYRTVAASEIANLDNESDADDQTNAEFDSSDE
jgi:hypothetical protein